MRTKISQSSLSDDATHFGFKSVTKADKAGLVRGVFDAVAPKYDLMNDLMSLGVHRMWKASFLDWLRPQANMRLIDVGGGTGDIALSFLERGGGDATVVDINEKMLSVGRDRAMDRGILDNIAWLNGDAECLALPDAIFDAYTIAFCIRNVTHIDAVLADARRVLKPGGRFMCLEFSHVALTWLEKIYDAYSFKILPTIGALVVGDRDAYQYLAESIRRFPPQDDFADMIKAAGFGQVSYDNLFGGIAAIHSAWRI
jgi:demethylmenaquinone methyltransferase/2-methoxy-6-polyprenyl-1,4-benzoquinol methylase